MHSFSPINFVVFWLNFADKSDKKFGKMGRGVHALKKPFGSTPIASDSNILSSYVSEVSGCFGA